MSKRNLGVSQFIKKECPTEGDIVGGRLGRLEVLIERVITHLEDIQESLDSLQEQLSVAPPQGGLVIEE